MASRAELIMSQVRGELGRIYRKKGPTTGEGVIEDLTGAALGWNTATELLYALEPGVQKIKDRRHKKNKRDLMDKNSGITTEQPDELLGDEFMSMEPMGPIFGPEINRTRWADLGLYGPTLTEPVRPDDPKRIVPRYVNPNEVPDDLPLYDNLPSEDEVEENLEAATGDLYLKGTIDTNFSNVGTYETTFQESTGHKFHNVNLDALKNQDGPPILNRDAYTVGQFAAGAPIDTISSDAESIQNEMYWNYFGTTTPPLEQPVRPMTLPIGQEDEFLGNLFPEAIPGEITIKKN